jgi:hypothetical protein
VLAVVEIDCVLEGHDKKTAEQDRTTTISHEFAVD